MELKYDGPGLTCGKQNLKSMTDVLRNSCTTKVGSEFESGFIDVLNVHNGYIRPNLGGYRSIGTRGERNIIKNIPVTHNDGYDVYDSAVAAHDYIDVPTQVLSTLDFKLTDARGNAVPLHGSVASFSLICPTMQDKCILVWYV